MMPSVDHPWVLLLLAGCWPAMLGSGLPWRGFASLSVVPKDVSSAILDWTLRAVAALAVLATVLGVAGLHDGKLSVERRGIGAPCRRSNRPQPEHG